eukprot:8448340-Heterocapsa_arctica.AAC.1
MKLESYEVLAQENLEFHSYDLELNGDEKEEIDVMSCLRETPRVALEDSQVSAVQLKDQEGEFEVLS